MFKNPQRSPLKWLGGKFSIIETVKAHLPESRRLIEPFVGSGTVFLNAKYSDYLLADINPDLINLFYWIKKDHPSVIDVSASLFEDGNNEAVYYSLRDEFNARNSDPLYHASVFLYLNRHCWRGVCRYNLSGGFNSPFGKYNKPYFPLQEICFMAEKLQSADLACQDFEATIDQAEPGDVVYCDPPYVPYNGNFTSYHSAGFAIADHERMSDALDRAISRGCRVIVSNSTADYLSDGYEVNEVIARRSISANGDRRPANEIIAVGVQ